MIAILFHATMRGLSGVLQVLDPIRCPATIIGCTCRLIFMSASIIYVIFTNVKHMGHVARLKVKLWCKT